MGKKSRRSKRVRQRGSLRTTSLSARRSRAISRTGVFGAVTIGGAGTARVRMLGGEVVSFAGLPAGSMLPLRVVQVMATGTTATGLVGLW